MRLTIQGRGLDDIFMINPDHHGGKYAIEYRSGVALLVSKPDHLLFQYQTTEFNVFNATSPAVFTGFMQFFRHFSRDDYWDTPLPWLGKSIKEVDVPQEIKIEWGPVYMAKDWNSILTRYFGCDVINLTDNTVKITYKKYTTCKEAMEVFYVISMLLTAITNEKIHEDQVHKLVRLMPTLPYFIIYLISHRVIKHEKIFNEVKEILEQKCEEEVKLVFGNTHDLRIKWVRENLGPGRVLDYGCGEFQHAKSKRLQGREWVGYDIENYAKITPRLYRDYGVIASFVTEDELDSVKPDVVVCSEVFEHMTPLEMDKTLVRMRGWKASQYLFTTVNVDFNKHYRIAGPRREDHVNEMIYDFFIDSVKKVFSFFKTGKIYFIECGGIGDTIDEVTPTIYIKVETLWSKIKKLF